MNNKEEKIMNIKKFNFKEKWAIIDRLFKNMDNDHISEYSAQCSYYTILSFIPFIILFLYSISNFIMNSKYICFTVDRNRIFCKNKV